MQVYYVTATHKGNPNNDAITKILVNTVSEEGNERGGSWLSLCKVAELIENGDEFITHMPGEKLGSGQVVTVQFSSHGDGNAKNNVESLPVIE